VGPPEWVSGLLCAVPQRPVWCITVNFCRFLKKFQEGYLLLNHNFEYITRFGGFFFFYIFRDFRNYFLLIAHKNKHTKIKEDINSSVVSFMHSINGSRHTVYSL
jgi:hypothetical protein